MHSRMKSPGMNARPVTRTSSLLYRGFPIRWPRAWRTRLQVRTRRSNRTPSRLEVGDTAGWKPALPRKQALLAVARTSSLLYRGFPIRWPRAWRTRLQVRTRRSNRTPSRLEVGETAGWKPALPRKQALPAVARASSLLYRGFPTRWPRAWRTRLQVRTRRSNRTPSRLEVGDTAGWKPALPRKQALLAVARTSSLLYRGFPIRWPRAWRTRLQVRTRRSNRTPSRLEVGETAGWKPALPRKQALPAVARASSLLYRGFPTRWPRAWRTRLQVRTRRSNRTPSRLEVGDTAGWKPALPRKQALLAVARTSSLLYRGFPIRWPRAWRTRLQVRTRRSNRTPSRLEVGDTAGWKPALPRKQALLAVARTSSLLYRGFPIRWPRAWRTRLQVRTRRSNRTPSRLEVGDTAGWKPALRQRSLRRWLFAGAAGALALAGFGIFPSLTAANKEPVGAAIPSVWPPPPAEPRVAYLQSISGPADLGIRPSGWNRFANLVTGGNRGKEKLVKPFGIALDELDNLCLTDTGTGRVWFFDRARKRVQSWEKAGGFRFASPVAIAKRKGIFYVADSALQKVVAFDGQGKLLFAIDQGVTRPAGLAVSEEKLFVADTAA